MDGLIEDIQTRYKTITERVEAACNRAKRSNQDVRIVVVSKTKTSEVINAAIEAGITCFGENYPEETASKIPYISKANTVEWHMIGHCQSRKTGFLVSYFNWMHSLDSIGLAEKLNNQLVIANKKLPVLIEINVAGEETKNGWVINDLKDIDRYKNDFDVISKLSNIQWVGLMTMPPLGPDSETSRPYFRKLANIRSTLQGAYPYLTLKHLSMGTSSDFETAIEEGATFVRIGQAILGAREYSNK